jgi:hypothetical protein
MKLKLGQKAMGKDGGLILRVDKKNGIWGNTCLHIGKRNHTWTLWEFKPMAKDAAIRFDDDHFISINFSDYYKQLNKQL